MGIPKTALAALLPLFFLATSHPQVPLRTIELEREQPSWSAALGGGAVAQPVETSYGIALLSEGRMLSGITYDGTVLWQRRVRGVPSPLIGAFGDFIYVVTGGNVLNLMNPSGVLLWSAKCPFAITSAPSVEKDGRVLVQGGDGIACYGLNGMEKWTAETGAQKDIPLCFMNDGSVVAFLRENAEGKTVAKRFSPFGEPIEDLRFTGEVLCASSCAEGVIVSLTNGAVGVCAVSDGETDQSWVAKSEFSSGAAAIAYSERSGNIAFFYQVGAAAVADIVKAATGEFITQIPVGNISLSGGAQAKATAAGFFIADTKTAVEFAEDGTVLWSCALPGRQKWTHLAYTDDNSIVVSMSNWIVNSYKMTQAVGTPAPPAARRTDGSFVKTRRAAGGQGAAHFIAPERMAEIERKLERGALGAEEGPLLTDIKSEAYEYLESLTTIGRVGGGPSFFAENPEYTHALMRILSKTGTAEFAHIFAELLRNEKDPDFLALLAKCAGEQRFDPDGEILSAFEFVLERRNVANDNETLKNICDATLEICRFMGRPALFHQGKNIVARLFYPQYSKTAQNYARATFDRIKSIEK